MKKISHKIGEKQACLLRHGQILLRSPGGKLRAFCSVEIANASWEASLSSRAGNWVSHASSVTGLRSREGEGEADLPAKGTSGRTATPPWPFRPKCAPFTPAFQQGKLTGSFSAETPTLCPRRAPPREPWSYSNFSSGQESRDCPTLHKSCRVPRPPLRL